MQLLLSLPFKSVRLLTLLNRLIHYLFKDYFRNHLAALSLCGEKDQSDPIALRSEQRLSLTNFYILFKSRLPVKQKTPTRIRKLAPISKVSPVADAVVNPSNALSGGGGGGGSARRKKRLTKTRQKSKSTAVLSKIVDSRRVAFLAGKPANFCSHELYSIWFLLVGRGLTFVGMTTLVIARYKYVHSVNKG